VRYLRSTGQDALVSQERNSRVPITKVKKKCVGVTPQEVDKYYKIIKDSFRGILDFVRYLFKNLQQSNEMSQDILRIFYDKGQFIEETTEQYYDEKNKTPLADRCIIELRPKCGNENAYGDQCAERCGSTLSPAIFIN
jgi:methionyl-tRNA synthetase